MLKNLLIDSTSSPHLCGNKFLEYILLLFKFSSGLHVDVFTTECCRNSNVDLSLKGRWCCPHGIEKLVLSWKLWMSAAEHIWKFSVVCNIFYYFQFFHRKLCFGSNLCFFSKITLLLNLKRIHVFWLTKSLHELRRSCNKRFAQLNTTMQLYQKVFVTGGFCVVLIKNLLRLQNQLNCTDAVIITSK